MSKKITFEDITEYAREKKKKEQEEYKEFIKYMRKNKDSVIEKLIDIL